ncbi:MAG: hypothetical protein ACHQQQ_13415 [Bacteroidota bacterium]
MIRFILWVLVFLFIVRFLGTVMRTRSSQRPSAPPQQPPRGAKQPLNNIQDADFEDITPPDPDKKK